MARPSERAVLLTQNHLVEVVKLFLSSVQDSPNPDDYNRKADRILQNAITEMKSVMDRLPHSSVNYASRSILPEAGTVNREPAPLDHDLDLELISDGDTVETEGQLERLVELESTSHEPSHDNQSPAVARPIPPDPAAQTHMAKPNRPVVVSSNAGGNYTFDQSEIEDMFKKSRSVQHFASNLMDHFFSEHELGHPKSTLGGLDLRRMGIIRRLVEQRAGDDELVWQTCISAMNAKLCGVKKRFQDANRQKAKAKNRRWSLGLLNQKISNHLKRSELFAHHGLCYETLDKIFCRAMSLPCFARDLTLHLFQDVFASDAGIDHIRSSTCLRRSDVQKFDLVRQLVMENSTNQNPTNLWTDCRRRINRAIRALKRL